jgi:hypothetical protein
MSKRCPYCQEPYSGRGGRSNEHLFPAWLCERRESKVSTSIAFPGKEIPNDMTINDVCSQCNNHELAEFDGYAKKSCCRYSTAHPKEWGPQQTTAS